MAAAMTDMMTMTTTQAPAKKEGPETMDGPQHRKPSVTGVCLGGRLKICPARKRLGRWRRFNAYHSDGFVIFPGVLKPNEVAALRAKIDAAGKA